jgi:hypothetical protein
MRNLPSGTGNSHLDLTGNFAYSCRAVVNGIDNNVSGEMDIVVGAPAAVLFVLPLHQ